MKTKIGVIGACGRMGQEIIKIIMADEYAELSAAVEYAGSKNIGAKAYVGSDIVVTTDVKNAVESSDVVIDFSGAQGTMQNFDIYATSGTAVVIGSTGFSAEEQAKLSTLGEKIPFFIATNMSMGVNLMTELVNKAAKALGEDFDIEIFEAHHKHKKDAPSGTALTLGHACAEGLGRKLEDVAVYERYGITGERQKGTIGFQVMRGGDIVGEHTVFYCGEGERIEITHRATSRVVFASGAVRAAKWMSKQPVGSYTMKDVLGL